VKRCVGGCVGWLDGTYVQLSLTVSLSLATHPHSLPTAAVRQLSLPFDADEEAAGELAQLVHKHAFVDYFARKFEGTDVAVMLVRIKAVLMYAATHRGSV